MTTTTITPDRFWFKVITAELVASWKFGFTFRNGSPAVRFRKVFPQYPTGKKEKGQAWLKQLLQDNPLLMDMASVTMRNFFSL